MSFDQEQLAEARARAEARAKAKIEQLYADAEMAETKAHYARLVELYYGAMIYPI